MSCFPQEEDDNCTLLGYYAASSGAITTITCNSLRSIPEQRSSHINTKYTKLPTCYTIKNAI